MCRFAVALSALVALVRPRVAFCARGNCAVCVPARTQRRLTCPSPQSCIRSVSASALCDAAKPALGACHASVSSQACCGALRMSASRCCALAWSAVSHRPACHVAHDRRASGLECGLLPLPRHAVVLLGAQRLARSLLSFVLRAQPSLVLASFSSHCAVASQSSLLSSFQQILTACGGNPITGSACPVSTPGAAPPSAPPAPAVTSVTAVWAYAVRIDASTIAVRRERAQLLACCVFSATTFLFTAGFVQVLGQRVCRHAARAALVC